MAQPPSILTNVAAQPRGPKVISLGNRQSPVHFVAAVNIRLGMVVHIPMMRRMVAGSHSWSRGLRPQGYFDAAMVAGTAVDHLPDEARHQFVTSEILQDLCKSSRIIIGHYTAPALLDAGCRSVATQVREPRSRLLSLCRY